MSRLSVVKRRDNLVFIGIDEIQTPSTMERASSASHATYAHATAGEDCASKIFQFCESILRIDNPRAKIHIDRAHRMGQAKVGKTRPIVAKFKDSQSKINIKSALKAINLKNTKYAVFDQLPQEIQDRRKALVPIMLKAREEKKTAYLVRDKLYINDKLYNSGVQG